MKKARPKQWWYSVESTSLYKVGDIVWVQKGEHKGYNEVRAVGRREILLRPLSRWDVWKRHAKGKWRRYWIRRRRGTVKNG